MRFLVAATFPIDAKGAPQTLAGTIHGINGPLIFLSLTIGMNLVSRGFTSDPRRRQIHPRRDFSFSRSRRGFCSWLLNSALMRFVSAKLLEATAFSIPPAENGAVRLRATASTVRPLRSPSLAIANG